MSGYCAIGRIALATRPAITMMIAMTPASTGRSMKNFENMSVGRGGGCRLLAGCRLCLGDDGDTRIQLHQVVEDDSVALVQTLADDPVLAEPIAELDGTLRGLAIRADGPYETALISLQHGTLWNCENLLGAGVEAHSRKLAGQNLELRIRELGAQLHCPACVID